MTLVITGTSSGIGFELSEYFGKKGHKVYGLSRKVTESDYFISVSVDITSSLQVESAIAQIVQSEGQIDVLINNAGMGMVGAVEDTQPEEIQQLFNLNLTGSVLLMKAVLPQMRKQRSGKILNISSIASEMGLPFRGFYSASKAALDKVTEASRYEVSPWNIQVSVLHLGDIKTNIAENRIRTTVSQPYLGTFEKVYGLMNAHVNKGTPPVKVAEFIEELISKKHLKAHYYFGKFGQKIGIPIKHFLPQNWFEKLMRRYNGLN